MLSTIVTATVWLSLPVLSRISRTECRCFPGDDCWPSNQEWNHFNNTLNGKLVASMPLAASCHDSPFGVDYNATECSILRGGWTLPDKHYASSSSVMSPLFANQSCDPFSARDSHCILSTYVQYAVAIESGQDVAAILAYARQKNIRVVIRNTGHDYNGKSTGAGSLAIWTHYLKSIAVLSYGTSRYTGRAMKIGAGVQAFEAYAAAHEHNLAIVGGECPTVGLAGGYTQGGGHSALASKYGLAADQVLEWEVILADGRHLTATRDQNSDLFWALSGGGGGTYGVVLSLTVKVYPDGPTTGANLTFSNLGVSQDAYWEAIDAHYSSLPETVDEGIMALSFITNETFTIAPMTGPGISPGRVNELLEPLTAKLERHGIKYTKFVEQYPTYYDQYKAMMLFNVVGVALYGGRLISRSHVNNNVTSITNAYRKIIANGGGITTIGLGVSKDVAGDVFNSVNPIWRDTLIDTVVTIPYDLTAPLSEAKASANKLSEEFMPLMIEISPGRGTYLNEADFQDPDWKRNYYGVNYDKLLEIKNKYDPEHLFYALTAVGSDYWEQQLDGRRCKSDSSWARSLLRASNCHHIGLDCVHNATVCWEVSKGLQRQNKSRAQWT